MMKRISLFLVFMGAMVLNAVASKAYRPNEIPNVHVQDRTRYVSNPDGVLSSQAEVELNKRLGAIWKNTTAEPVVVAVERIDDNYTPAEFADQLGESWGVGKSDTDNGVVMLLVRSDHKFHIAVGRGAEGVLPDALVGRIIRNEAIPHFRNDDYDGGVIAAVDAVDAVLSNPNSADEIRSGQSFDGGKSELSGDRLFDMYVYWCAVVAAAMLLWVLGVLWSNRKKSDLQCYTALERIVNILLFLSFITLGMGAVSYGVCRMAMLRTRNHKRVCANCAHVMRKLDEQTDNMYLTPSQDVEEHLNSVDYDVWLCDQCGLTDIIPYVNRNKDYAVCSNCGARAMSPMGERILVRPTMTREGKGVKIRRCLNCGHEDQTPFNIPRNSPPVVVVPSGGSGGFGGGGMSGGSFGGGSFGGGGATGSW